MIDIQKFGLANGAKPKEPRPHLIALRRFRADLDVAPCTPWRWIKKGWLGKPQNIGGRLYLTLEQVLEFERRAAAGEFSRDIRPPAPVKRKEEE